MFMFVVSIFFTSLRFHRKSSTKFFCQTQIRCSFTNFTERTRFSCFGIQNSQFFYENAKIREGSDERIAKNSRWRHMPNRCYVASAACGAVWLVVWGGTNSQSEAAILTTANIWIIISSETFFKPNTRTINQVPIENSNFARSEDIIILVLKFKGSIFFTKGKEIMLGRKIAEIGEKVNFTANCTWLV